MPPDFEFSPLVPAVLGDDAPSTIAGPIRYQIKVVNVDNLGLLRVSDIFKQDALVLLKGGTRDASTYKLQLVYLLTSRIAFELFARGDRVFFGPTP